MAVSFDVTTEESRLIAEIVDRALGATDYDRQVSAQMDLTACHANGCPLDLQRLLDADDFNLAHDVYGISRHIDRETGTLTGCFLPRFALPQSEES